MKKTLFILGALWAMLWITSALYLKEEIQPQITWFIAIFIGFYLAMMIVTSIFLVIYFTVLVVRAIFEHSRIIQKITNSWV